MRCDRWTGPDQLVLEIDTIAGINHFIVTLNFEGGALQLLAQYSSQRFLERLVCSSQVLAQRSIDQRLVVAATR